MGLFLGCFQPRGRSGGHPRSRARRRGVSTGMPSLNVKPASLKVALCVTCCQLASLTQLRGCILDHLSSSCVPSCCWHLFVRFAYLYIHFPCLMACLRTHFPECWLAAHLVRFPAYFGFEFLGVQGISLTSLPA